MRSFVPAIYDITVAIPKSSPAPTMLRLFEGQPSVVSVLTLHQIFKMIKVVVETCYKVNSHCVPVPKSSSPPPMPRLIESYPKWQHPWALIIF